MKCPVCNHENGDARFCERCGSNLNGTHESDNNVESVAHTDSSDASSEYTRWSSTQEPVSNRAVSASSSISPIPSPAHDHDDSSNNDAREHGSAHSSSGNQWNNFVQNEKVQQAKEVSKQYLTYFLSVLARPYQSMKTVGEQHALNGWLTMALFAVLTSTYVLITFGRLGAEGIFISGFLRPLLFSAIILVAAVALIYGVLKLERITFRPKILVAQFGTLLVPAIATLLLANLMIVISYSFAISLLVLSYIMVFVAMNTVLFQHPLNRTKAAIDSTYSVLIVNAVLFYLMYRLLFSTIAGLLSPLFSPFGRL
ncbi:zinc ribbon domain-containing protein [Paenibacillus xylanexedens]|uniref:zinc ribbon domain-containing protein n=1 Tax=Paenibacillus xylanexedens TaxID=528191 RepID=UPI0011A747F8|nr:zinc ribbon domain-containing protein [Paenibacillus xylanexedens]